jgi:hypothetical protein
LGYAGVPGAGAQAHGWARFVAAGREQPMEWVVLTSTWVPHPLPQARGGGPTRSGNQSPILRSAKDGAPGSRPRDKCLEAAVAAKLV